jgi:hypothetical protein
MSTVAAQLAGLVLHLLLMLDLGFSVVGLHLGLLPVLAILVFDFGFLLVVTISLGFHFRRFLALLRRN